jgi:hypothetical protein
MAIDFQVLRSYVIPIASFLTLLLIFLYIILEKRDVD